MILATLPIIVPNWKHQMSSNVPMDKLLYLYTRILHSNEKESTAALYKVMGKSKVKWK